jgi:7-cyano-7-deazaguanine reductase
VPTSPSKDLLAVDNPHPGRAYEIRCETPELTCLCPMTGQPDFGTVVLTYIPEAKIVELKSLKLYLWSFRDEGHYHEDVTNRILDDLVAAIAPRSMTVQTIWNVRGGITTTVTARHPATEPPT